MIALEAVLLGVVIGVVLGGLGGGGAILTVPALVYLLGQPAQAATTGSLVIVGLSAITGAASYVRARQVRWRLGLAFGLVGLPATWLGSVLNHRVDQHLLMLGFSGLMLAAAVAMVADRVRRRPPSTSPATSPATPPATTSEGRAPEQPSRAPASGPVATLTRPWVAAPPRRSPVTVVVAALLVGLLTGFFGVGGGFVVVPALALVLGMPMPQAIGTSLLIVAANSATSLLSRVGGPPVDWAVVVPFALAAMAAAVLGKQAAGRLPARGLALGFALLLVLVAGYTGWQSIAGLTA